MPTKRSSKKDFDREQMYQKIMPSLIAVSGRDNFADKLTKNPLRTGSGTERVGAVNLMELVLLDILEQPMRILRCCDCERCRNDIVALTLNNLPAHYAIMEAPQLQQKIIDLRNQYEVKVKSALIQAIQQVKANPHHDFAKNG